MKITKKFYVGSRSVVTNNREWAHSALEEAIEHARELAEESKQDQFVVQIIKVVRRERPPVTVEDVE